MRKQEDSSAKKAAREAAKTLRDKFQIATWGCVYDATEDEVAGVIESIIQSAIDADRKALPKRDGNWIDEMGCCKVCDGEIPYGHTENCDIYKLEKQIANVCAGATRIAMSRNQTVGEKHETT